LSYVLGAQILTLVLRVLNRLIFFFL